MCDVVVSDDGVHIDPTGWEHTGGMVGPFVVAFDGIDKVSTNDNPIDLVHGLKVGVGLPNTRIGTWRHDGIEDYFCIHKDGPAVALRLKAGQRFGQVVVTVDDPTQVTAQIQAHLDAAGSPNEADQE